MALSASTRAAARPPHSLRPAVRAVVAQHVEESAHLADLRDTLVRAPHLRLPQLGRLDERISAHLDGIVIAGEAGTRLVLESLERIGKGEVFVATVGAIEGRDMARLDRLLAVTEVLPATRAGLLSAFGWVSAPALRGITGSLLTSVGSPWRRKAGLMACAMHGVNPGAPLTAGLHDANEELRATALRVAGRCARADLVESCLAALTDTDRRCAFEAARSAVLIGHRAEALARLETLAVDATSPFQLEALQLALKVMPTQRARTLLASMAQEPAQLRALIQGVAIAGDAHYVPWLIGQMPEPKVAGLAGEAFALITGLDLVHLGFDRKPPDGVVLGPNDDPDDDDVAMDKDDGLPWPDASRIAAWWAAHGARFTPGTRCFMGRTPTPSTCLEVLKTGFQRQRAAAAEYLALLTPGTPLFDTAAPTRRQLRLLGLAAQMT